MLLLLPCSSSGHGWIFSFIQGRMGVEFKELLMVWGKIRNFLLNRYYIVCMPAVLQFWILNVRDK